MKNENSQSMQNWLPFDRIMEKGVIKIMENEYIKIIKIIPINYNLKSDLEKSAILNSYKTFLKTCNFDIQILIQSNREDLSKHISNIEEKVKIEQNSNLTKISKNYIEFIKKVNQEKNSVSKNFYIVIKNENKLKDEQIVISELEEKYFKIKESLSRCGNKVIQIEEKEETKEILFSFFNTRKNLLK